jgi:hypothetical protein
MARVVAIAWHRLGRTDVAYQAVQGSFVQSLSGGISIYDNVTYDKLRRVENVLDEP